jgi:hypothetical protein
MIGAFCRGDAPPSAKESSRDKTNRDLISSVSAERSITHHGKNNLAVERGVAGCDQ